MGRIFVCYNQYSITKLPVIHCPTCNKRRRFLAQYQEGYGPTITCLGCGDTRSDGRLCEA